MGNHPKPCSHTASNNSRITSCNCHRAYCILAVRLGLPKTERKVGCDRALPACANCTRAKRECKGYGLKLAWPDKYDGRRKQKKYEAEPDLSATNYVTKLGEFYFLNTSIGDIQGQKHTVRDLVETGCPAFDFCVPRSVSPRLLDLGEREGSLLSYCECSTITTPSNPYTLRLHLLHLLLARSTDAVHRSHRLFQNAQVELTPINCRRMLRSSSC